MIFELENTTCNISGIGYRYGDVTGNGCEYIYGFGTGTGTGTGCEYMYGYGNGYGNGSGDGFTDGDILN